MKLLNDLGFRWKIARKGRKIKKGIPVIKSEGEQEAATASRAEVPPALESTGERSNGLVFEQVGSPTRAGIEALSPVAATTSSTSAGLQGIPGVGNIDIMNVAHGLQNPFSAFGTIGGLPVLGGQAAASLPAAANLSSRDAVGVQQGTQSSAQPPTAAILLPIQLGNIMQNQQAQVLPISMQWPSHPGLGLGLQPMLLNIPPAATQAPAPQPAQNPTFNQSQAAQLLSMLLMGALPQQTPQLAQGGQQQAMLQLFANALAGTQPAAPQPSLQPIQQQPPPPPVQQQQQQQPDGGANAGTNQALVASLASILAGHLVAQPGQPPQNDNDAQDPPSQPPPPPPN